MRRRAGQLALSAGVIAIACGAIGAGQAVARAHHGRRTPVKIRSATTALPSVVGGTASATATCPRRTIAVGGGFATNVPVKNGSTPYVYESQRVSDTQWRASAATRAASGAVTAYVECGKQPTAIASHAASGTAPAFVLGVPPAPGPTATCPGKTKVLSGGFLLAPSAESTVFAIQSSLAAGPASWTASEFNSSSGPSPITVFVYCTKGKPVHTATASTPLPTVEYGAADALTPPCPRKRKAVSGGFSSGIVVGPNSSLGLVYESRPQTTKTWLTSAVQSENSGTSQLTSFAYCG